MRKRIAIVGAGVAGLTAAHRLHPDHDVTVFEADASRAATPTRSASRRDGGARAVDTGFIVHNDRNYPRFQRAARPRSAWRRSRRT